MKDKRVLAVAMMLLGAMLMVGAGCGGKSCTTLCEEAQAGKCTAIKGNCTNFCSALESEYSTANCSSAYDDYQSCLSTGSSACDSSCGAQEVALSKCMTIYCFTRLAEPNCKTMASSF